MTTVDVVHTVGDRRHLDLPKTAFLCSRQVPAAVVLKCFDWAIEQREAGRCVISGFHSTIEKDVFHYLIKGSQPVIIALHHTIGPKIKRDLAEEISSGRLLIISPFDKTKQRGGVREAAVRNRLMIELADKVVVGHASEKGELRKLLDACSPPVTYLDGSTH